MPKSNSKKQAEFKSRQVAAGLKRKEYWATEDQHRLIKEYVAKLEGDTAPINR